MAAGGPDRQNAGSPPPGFVDRAFEATDRFLGWFPVRVWNRFSRRNGLVLAAGTSDQALFALFAGLFAAFAILGLWLGQNPAVVDALIHGVSDIVPGLIRFESSQPGVLDADDVRDVALGSAGALSITGIIAIIAVLWTATGWITFLRSAVRDMFGLPPAELHFVLLKVVDFLAALVFAVLLAVGAILNTVGTSALGWVFQLIGIGDSSSWFEPLARVLSIVVAFGVDAFIIAALFLYLADTDLTWRRVLSGSLVGGGALAILQLLAGFVITRVSVNPLVVTFTVLLGMLIWLRLQMAVILLAAAWVAEQAASEGVDIIERSPEQVALDEADALVLAAQVRLRDARTTEAGASRWRRRRATADTERAERELDHALERRRAARIDEQNRQRRQLVRRGRPSRNGDVGASS